MKKEKIFVSAYACEPNKGSEIGVGWHWVLEMSKYFELWVLTRKSNKLNIENWLALHKEYKDIHFVYYDLPSYVSWWKKGLRGVRTYYCIWQKMSNKLVKKTMQINNINIYHLLTYGNALWSASRYGMKQLFIWGPIGGTDCIPKEFYNHYGNRAKFIEIVRSLAIKLIPLNVGFNKRCKNAKLILCKTDRTIESIPQKYREKAVQFTDVAIEYADEQIYEEHSQSKITKYLAVGKFDAWRGFDVLIEAFSDAIEHNSELVLEIIGDGVDKSRLQKLIYANNLNKKVTLCGSISHEEYLKKIKEADVVVNPVLKEGGVTVAFDTLLYEKILIATETQGYTKSINSDFAIIIEVDKRKALIENLANAIIETAKIENRQEMKKKISIHNEIYSWSKKGEDIFKLINSVLK